jgi:very-short-patch-repair endonuclease
VATGSRPGELREGIKFKPTGRRLNASERRALQALGRLGIRVVPSAQIEAWEVDFLFPDHAALLEVDGPKFHSRPEQARRDEGQDKRFRELGLLPIHCSTESLYEAGGETKVLKHIVERLYHERGLVLPIFKDRTFRKYYRRLGYTD